MSSSSQAISDQIESVLRRMARSMELHSRSMVQRYGLTAPQAALVKALTFGPLTAGELASRINLSQGTVTDILNRLEARGLVQRLRDAEDKRRVIVSLSDKGSEIVHSSSLQLQAPLNERLAELPDWEQSQLLSSLQRIAHLMEGGSPTRDVFGKPAMSGGTAVSELRNRIGEP